MFKKDFIFQPLGTFVSVSVYFSGNKWFWINLNKRNILLVNISNTYNEILIFRILLDLPNPHNSQAAVAKCNYRNSGRGMGPLYGYDMP